jgi:hypothetical protein
MIKSLQNINFTKPHEYGKFLYKYSKNKTKNRIIFYILNLISIYHISYVPITRKSEMD